MSLKNYVSVSVIEEYIKTHDRALIPKKILLKEDVCFEDGVNIDISKAERFVKMYDHMHDFFEIECVLQGSCTHKVEDKKIRISDGDIVLVPPEVSHAVVLDDNCILLNLKIRRSTFDSVFMNFLSADTPLSSYLSRALYSKSFRSSMTFHCCNDSFVKDLLLSMYRQSFERKPFFSYMLEGMTITLFSYLVQNCSDSFEISNTILSKDFRIREILEYMNKNYKTATLKGTADKFYMSSSYLSTKFKQETGSTFLETLREIKMKTASNLLMTTDLKVDIICEQSGYKDTTQFIKTFKKYYGVSPKKYRQSNHLLPSDRD